MLTCSVLLEGALRCNPISTPYVLVVDQQALLRETLADVLEEFGYAVSAAADGQEALRSLERDPHCGLMLLDAETSPMSAAEVVVRLKAHRRLARVPVVLLSADPQIGAQAAMLGCDGSLGKPISVAELLAVAGGCLSAPSRDFPAAHGVRANAVIA